MSLEIEIINNSNHPLPSYATDLSAGMDLRAFLPEGNIILQPGEHQLIPTGLNLALPEGFEAQIRPRSGLAYKKGVTVLNAPGTIDADYRGDVGVILINHGQASFEIKDGDRIAQIVVAPFTKVSWKSAKFLASTKRGEGGFGHTGKQ